MFSLLKVVLKHLRFIYLGYINYNLQPYYYGILPRVGDSPVSFAYCKNNETTSNAFNH